MLTTSRHAHPFLFQGQPLVSRQTQIIIHQAVAPLAKVPHPVCSIPLDAATGVHPLSVVQGALCRKQLFRV